MQIQKSQPVSLRLIVHQHFITLNLLIISRWLGKAVKTTGILISTPIKVYELECNSDTINMHEVVFIWIFWSWIFVWTQWTYWKLKVRKFFWYRREIKRTNWYLHVQMSTSISHFDFNTHCPGCLALQEMNRPFVDAIFLKQGCEISLFLSFYLSTLSSSLSPCVLFPLLFLIFP